MPTPEVTSPADGAVNVTAPFTASGVNDPGDIVQVEATWNGGGTGYVTTTVTGSTFVADQPFSPPAGEVVTFNTRRCAPIALNNFACVSPEETGNRIDAAQLISAAAAGFPSDGANDYYFDTAFLNANAGASWLSSEGGVPVVSGIDFGNRGLRMGAQAILRDCTITSPVRAQPATWGFPQSDAPVVLITAANSTVEYCDIAGTGFDDDISSRGVWVSGANSIVQYNDISGVRGAVQQFTGNIFQYNYCHDFAFGWQANRAGNVAFNGLPDEVTHNNPTGNLGYKNAIVRFNNIDGRYGRVSALQPGDPRYPFRLTPIFPNVYNNGVEVGEVVVGDPIDGFAFTNYLQQDDGDGFEVYDNCVSHVGRAFLAQTGEDDATPTAAADFSRNLFIDHRFDDFNAWLGATGAEANGSTYAFSGSCNQEIIGGVVSVLPATFFNQNNHGTTGCTLAVP